MIALYHRRRVGTPILAENYVVGGLQERPGTTTAEAFPVRANP